MIWLLNGTDTIPYLLSVEVCVALVLNVSPYEKFRRDVFCELLYCLVADNTHVPAVKAILPILEIVALVGGVVDILDPLIIPPTCVDVGTDTVPEWLVVIYCPDANVKPLFADILPVAWIVVDDIPPENVSKAVAVSVVVFLKYNELACSWVRPFEEEDEELKNEGL